MLGGQSMQKNKASKINKIYAFLMVFSVLGFASYLLYKCQILTEYNEKIATINKEIEDANKKNKELQNQAEYKSSTEYIEKIARDKLGMVKSNEIVFYDEN